MKLFSTLLFTFITFSIFGQGLPSQPFAPTIPSGMDPVWYQTMFDTTSVDENYDGYNHFSSLFSDLSKVDDNEAFLLSARRGVKGIIGYYLEKRSVISGEILWRRYFGYPETPYIDMPRHTHVNEKGNIEIFSQTYPSTVLDSINFLGSREMVFMFREINGLTGDILEESMGDPDDPNTFRSHFTIFPLGTHSSLFRIDKNKYKFFELAKQIPNQKQKYKVSIVSSKSKKSNAQTDSIKIISFPSVIPPIQIENKNYLLIEKIIETDQFIFIKLDASLNIISQDTSPIYEAEFDVIEWSKDHIKVLVDNVPIDFPDSKISLDVVAYSKVDSAKVLQKYTFEDIKRANGSFHIFDIPNSDDVLLRWTELAFTEGETGELERDYYAQALSVLRVRRSDLISSIKEKVLGKQSMTITPNPTDDHISLTLPKSITGSVHINNSMGNLIQSESLKNQNKIVLNVAHLSSGIYFIKTINEDRVKMYSGKIIKI